MPITFKTIFNPRTLILLCLFSLMSCSNDGWRTASRESANLAPDPSTTQEAVLQVYGADAWSWRGWFAIHTWVAAKRSGENFYRIYDVIGWRANRNQSVMNIYQDLPDRFWFGAKPKIFADLRGEGVDELIDKVTAAAHSYPWQNTYKVFPGPNSNTFVAWIGQEVPELALDLPFTAIGKGYLSHQPKDQ